MPNTLMIYTISLIATFTSVLFMLFIVSWTLLDIITFNAR